VNSTGLSSRNSRIPTKPTVPEKDSRELPGQADTTDSNEPIKKFSGRSPATLLAYGWKKKTGITDSNYHRSK
jgi:hypothetical protein